MRKIQASLTGPASLPPCVTVPPADAESQKRDRPLYVELRCERSTGISLRRIFVPKPIYDAGVAASTPLRDLAVGEQTRYGSIAGVGVHLCTSKDVTNFDSLEGEMGHVDSPAVEQ